MKGTLKIKLLPSEDQAKSLLKTIKQANAACNTISEAAWDRKLFNQYKIHHETYHQIRATYHLPAQVVALCIGKVADAYKSGRKTKRQFQPLGAITYDSRILTYWEKGISLWTVDGRLKEIPFVCHNNRYFPFRKGGPICYGEKGNFICSRQWR